MTGILAIFSAPKDTRARGRYFCVGLSTCKDPKILRRVGAQFRRIGRSAKILKAMGWAGVVFGVCFVRTGIFRDFGVPKDTRARGRPISADLSVCKDTQGYGANERAKIRGPIVTGIFRDF